MSIYNLIPSDTWITRQELVHKSGMSDRRVRMEINELRKHPETVIVSSSHGKGYKRPENRQELEICLAESISRVRDEEEKQKVLRKAICEFERKQADVQYTFDF